MTWGKGKLSTEPQETLELKGQERWFKEHTNISSITLVPYNYPYTEENSHLHFGVNEAKELCHQYETSREKWSLTYFSEMSSWLTLVGLIHPCLIRKNRVGRIWLVETEAGGKKKKTLSRILMDLAESLFLELVSERENNLGSSHADLACCFFNKI